jgi:dTDP-4-dehydrorhamnose 3,5-epimerase
VAQVLSAENWLQVLVPIGFAHGYCTLEPDCEIIYKVTSAYAPEHDRGLAWDDPALAIPWPVAAADAILAEKDRNHPRLEELDTPFR